MAIGSMMMAFASLGMPSYIFKFYPYYKDNLPEKKNDMLTWSLLVTLIGFFLVIIAGIVFKQIIIRKFGEHSPLLLTYYNWIFPMGFGLTFYNLLEVYTWNFNKSILTNYLKEVQWRLLTTVLIVLLIIGVIRDFDLFIKLYSFTYPVIALTLFLYLYFTGKIHFTFSVSKVTRRYFKKILQLCTYVYSGMLIFYVSQAFDTLVLASLSGLKVAGIFGLAQLMTSIIQAPQRGVISASIPHLSRAWKEKNMGLLQKVYQRSSINLLIFAAGIFILIALNYKQSIIFFNLKETFLLGFSAFIVLGITRIIDLGTGVNAQIIATSTFWKFELTSGVALLVVMLPLTYIFTKEYGMIGPAIANLISISIYNFIRIVFLWKKFRLFPFTMQTIYTLLLAGVCFVFCYLLLYDMDGFPGLAIRSIVFIILYVSGVVFFRLSPDLQPVLETLKKRLGKKKN
jgi:O-antigen/teichoic acid export membrane protein